MDPALAAPSQTKGRSDLGALLHLAGPAIMARLGIMTMGLVDAVVVGHYSARELAYQGLAWSPVIIILTTGIGLLMGVQIIGARVFGEGQNRAMGMVLRRGMVYALLLGLGTAFILTLTGRGLLVATQLPPDLVTGTTPVLIVLGWSLPFYLCATALMFWFEGSGQATPGMIAMWVANAANLVLNLLLVPDHLGLGVDGALASAWTTLVARGVLLLVLIIWLFYSGAARRYHVFERGNDGRGREQMEVGYATGIAYFVETTAFCGNVFIAGQLGTTPVAVWSIIINFTSLIAMVPLGFAAATAVLVGQAYGAGDRRRVWRAGRLGWTVAGIVCLLIMLGIWIWNAPLAAAYSSDPALIALTASALVLSCIFILPDGLQFVGASALRGRADIWWPTANHFFLYGCVMLPLGWLLAIPFGLGLAGIIFSIAIVSWEVALFLAGRFMLLAWRDRRAAARAAK